MFSILFKNQEFKRLLEVVEILLEVFAESDQLKLQNDRLPNLCQWPDIH